MNRWSAPRGVTMYEHGDGEYYIASEVGDREAKHLARISELERATDIAIQLNNDHQQRISELETAIKELHEAGTAVANRRDELVARIAELEKALRSVSIVDLGFGVPRWFCAACASYGRESSSIQHKPDCVIPRTITL